MTSLDSPLTLTTLDPLTLEPLPPETRERLLSFPLSKEENGLLPLEQITEIMRLNWVEILPVPEMPSCILGIGNWRGEMLWLVDLKELVGYTPLSKSGKILASPVAIVIEVNHQSLGLVVEQVNDIELHDLQRLQPATAGTFPPKIMPFVLGSLPGVSSIVLDITAISRLLAGIGK
ncbi:MAG: chemotaxis protein CheW [Symploca sp. SIO2E6]|nr:chemotaxis protein CheW [Symploca sp. SIO2E6]